MNPLTRERVEALVRWGVTLLVGYLVHRGVIDQDSSLTLTALAVAALGPLAWSFSQKSTARLKLLTALTAPPGTTEADVERHIDLTPKSELPSVTTPKDMAPPIGPAAGSAMSR